MENKRLIHVIEGLLTKFITAEQFLLLLEEEGFEVIKIVDDVTKLKERTERLNQIFSYYPVRKGNPAKYTGMKVAISRFKTKKSLDDLERAVKNFKNAVERREHVGGEFIPQWATFVRTKWVDWLDVSDESNQPKFAKYEVF